MASAGSVRGLDGWKAVGNTLTRASEKLLPLAMRAGFHNHKLEFVPLDGKASKGRSLSAPKEVMLQLDVGTCVDAGSDLLLDQSPSVGSIASTAKTGQQARGVSCSFGEGDSPWKDIIDAAETVGGVEFYLIFYEGSRYPAMETAERMLGHLEKVEGLTIRCSAG